MIFNIAVAGKRKVAVTVYGAPSETVTITTGIDTYTVTTNANGIGTTTPELKPGTYTVTGTKSKTVSGFASGRSVTVDKNTTVIKAYPEGALFWLGNGDTVGDSLWSIFGGWSFVDGAKPSGGDGYYGYGSGSMSSDKYTISIGVPSSAGSLYACSVFNNSAVSLSGYKYVKILLDSGYDYCSAGVGFPANAGDAWDTSIFSGASSGVKSISIPSSRTSGYFAASLYGCSRGGWGSISVKAIWLE